jgi:hypothetical protein
MAQCVRIGLISQLVVLLKIKFLILLAYKNLFVELYT